MAHENLESLKSLAEILEGIDQLIDDENYFDTDIEKYVQELQNSLNEVNELLEEIIENDPEIPLSHEHFLKRDNAILESSPISYKRLLDFGSSELNQLKKEVEQLLDDDKDKPRMELFDQLTIPIMSLVNHQEHPTRPGYLVYHFKIAEHAKYFEELLRERDLFYERFDEERGGESVYWFGVRDRDHDAVEMINYTVKGKFRKPMIRDKGVRYVIVGFGILLVLFAIVGAIMSKM